MHVLPRKEQSGKFKVRLFLALRRSLRLPNAGEENATTFVLADVSRGTSLRIRFRFHVLRLQDVNRCPTRQADPNRTPRSHNRKAPRLVEKAGDKARISLDNSRRRIGAV